MKTGTETLEDFYSKSSDGAPEGFCLDRAHFNLFRIGQGEPFGKNRKTMARFTRKDFYKIGIVHGESLFHYADKSIKTSGATLMFFNSLVPYTWQPLNEDCTAITCIFNDAFFSEYLHTPLRNLPMFMPGNKPSYELQEPDRLELERIFEKMQTELSSTYRLKYDLIRNYLVEILHFALKRQPSESIYTHSSANARITSLFIEQLERQFPIESPDQQFSLRSPSNFAEKLSVHVNHLNRAIKETTGKTTSTLVAERVVAEAKALLKQTSWTILEISYSLGFEDMAHFDHYFKKQTFMTPSAYRLAP